MFTVIRSRGYDADGSSTLSASPNRPLAVIPRRQVSLPSSRTTSLAPLADFDIAPYVLFVAQCKKSLYDDAVERLSMELEGVFRTTPSSSPPSTSGSSKIVMSQPTAEATQLTKIGKLPSTALTNLVAVKAESRPMSAGKDSAAPIDDAATDFLSSTGSTVFGNTASLVFDLPSLDDDSQGGVLQALLAERLSKLQRKLNQREHAHRHTIATAQIAAALILLQEGELLARVSVRAEERHEIAAFRRSEVGLALSAEHHARHHRNDFGRELARTALLPFKSDLQRDVDVVVENQLEDADRWCDELDRRMASLLLSLEVSVSTEQFNPPISNDSTESWFSVSL